MKIHIKIIIKPWELPSGHQPHRGGNGAHEDKRTKRNRTRGDQKRNAIKDEE